MLLRAIIFEHVIVKKGRPAVTASIIVIVTVYVAAPVPSSSPLSLGPLPLGRPTFAPLTGPPPAFFDFISVEKEEKKKRKRSESCSGLVRRKTCEKQGSTGGIARGDILAASTSLFYCAHFSSRLFSLRTDIRGIILLILYYCEQYSLRGGFLYKIRYLDASYFIVRDTGSRTWPEFRIRFWGKINE